MKREDLKAQLVEELLARRCGTLPMDALWPLIQSALDEAERAVLREVQSQAFDPFKYCGLCYFCGASEHGSHKPKCVWPRALAAAPDRSGR